MTTGAFVLRCGYTTQSRSESPAWGTVLIVTHSPWRGELASRAAAVVAPGAIEESPGTADDTGVATGVTMVSWSCTFVVAAFCAQPVAKIAAATTNDRETFRERRRIEELRGWRNEARPVEPRTRQLIIVPPLAPRERSSKDKRHRGSRRRRGCSIKLKLLWKSRSSG